MAAATEGTLDYISKNLASSPGGAWLEKISKQLDSRGAKGNDPFMGFKVPQLTDVAKGLFFGLAPGLVKKSVSGMQTFVDALNNINIPDADASLKIAKVIDNFSDAIINFGDISWSKAFKGTFLIQSFTDRFVKIGEVLGSPENLTRLQPFRAFAANFAKPLTKIGDALLYFNKIQWVKIFFGSKLFKKIVQSFITVGELAASNEASLLTLGSILELVSKPIGDFFENFNKIKFVKIVVGSLLFETVIKSLVGISKLVSDNEASFKKLGEVLTDINEPLGNFAESFNKIGNGLIKASVSLLIVAGSLSLAAFGLKQLGDINLKQAAAGIITLGSIMAAVYGLSKIANDAIKGAAALAIVSASLGIAAFSLKLFSKDIEWAAVAGGITALGTMAVGLKLLANGSAEMIKGAAAIGIVAASLGIAALSFKLFAGLTDIFGSVALGIGTLGAIMLGLVGLGTLLAGPQAIAIGAAIGLMAAVGLAIIPFVAGLKILGSVNWKSFDGIYEGLKALGLGVGWITVGIPAMIAGAIALIPFALGLKILSSVDWNKFEGIAIALKSLGDGVKQISAFALIKAGSAMIPFAAGVAALRLAIAGNDKISTFLEKFNKGLNDLKGDSLLLAAKGILALSGALVAFAGTQVLSGIGNLIGKILRFGSDSPIDQLIKLAKHGYNLSILGTGVKDLAAGLKALTGIDGELNILETLSDKFKVFDTLDPTGIKAFAEGLNMLVTSLTALSQLDGKLSVLNDIPYDKLKSLSESIKIGTPLSKMVDGLKESEQSKQTAQLLKQGISSNAPTVGSQLRESGASMNSPTVIVNNSGGNVTNNSSTSSNVNNNGSSNTPIITASGSGMFTAE